MTFAREKRMLLGWLALVSPVPLPFNAILEWPILIAFMVSCLLFLRRAARDPGGWLPTWAMNVLGLAYLPYFVFDLAVLSRGRLVVAVTHLLLFTTLVKLFAIRRERDKWQTAIAVFFLFLTSMGTSVHPTVALYLAVFVGLTLWTFARFAQLHLMAAFAVTEKQRRALLAIPMRGFLVGSVLAALLLAVPLFALLPRVESPFVPGQGRGMGTLGSATGFSDVVTLDSIGTIRTNREVAMRLRYEDGVPAGHELRYKGGAFEIYDDGTWSPRRFGWERLRRSEETGGAFRLAPGEPVGWVEVFLRPVAGRNVLLPPESVRIEADVDRLGMDDRGLVRRAARGGSAMEYRVGLAEEPVPKAVVPYGDGIEDGPDRGGARPGAGIEVGPDSGQTAEGWMEERVSAQVENATLDLSGVTPAISELAARVAGDGSTLEQARGIERFLTTEFEYTLDYVGQEGVEDPLAHFLFERRQGHCEYFATAMVLMLRSRGIPARLVTGFLGGEYSPLQGYYVVRQSNAHAWVEAYLPDGGWTTFDPTPPAGRPVLSEAGWRQALAQAWDAILFRWDRYVLTYGFTDQIDLLFFFRDAWEAVKGWFVGEEGEESAEPPVIVEGAEDGAPSAAEAPEAGLSAWLLALPAVVLAVLLLGFWLRARRPLSGPEAYRRLRRSAGRAGLALRPADPPLDFSDRFERSFPEAASPGAEVVRLYVRERWAEEPLGDEARERLGTALKEAVSVLRKAG